MESCWHKSSSVCDQRSLLYTLYSEQVGQEETFAASRVISSQILGYDGGEVDSKEKVEVIFPLTVRMCLKLSA